MLYGDRIKFPFSERSVLYRSKAKVLFPSTRFLMPSPPADGFLARLLFDSAMLMVADGEHAGRIVLSKIANENNLKVMFFMVSPATKT
jgi:hypothetical protein